jgi:hypothetical protein
VRDVREDLQLSVRNGRYDRPCVYVGQDLVVVFRAHDDADRPPSLRASWGAQLVTGVIHEPV